MREFWLPIPGVSGYAASDQGRIKSITRRVSYTASDQQPAYSHVRKGQVLKPHKKPSGHLQVVPGRAAGSKDVHCLVALAWFGPRPAGAEVRHLNGDPADNRPANLRYGTRQENVSDRYLHGSRHGRQKLQASDVLHIRASKAKGVELAKQFGVTPQAISHIRCGRSWKALK